MIKDKKKGNDHNHQQEHKRRQQPQLKTQEKVTTTFKSTRGGCTKEGNEHDQDQKNDHQCKRRQ